MASKRLDQIDRRREIISGLAELMRLPRRIQLLEDNADAFDLAVCVLAGVDFLEGRTIRPYPAAMIVIRKEGWIWVGGPS